MVIFTESWFKTKICTYLVQLVKIQNLSFHVRDFQSASLKLPEFCNLIQEVELNSGLSLKAVKQKLMLYIEHLIIY